MNPRLSRFRYAQDHYVNTSDGCLRNIAGRVRAERLARFARKTC